MSSLGRRSTKSGSKRGGRRSRSRGRAAGTRQPRGGSRASTPRTIARLPPSTLRPGVRFSPYCGPEHPRDLVGALAVLESAIAPAGDYGESKSLPAGILPPHTDPPAKRVTFDLDLVATARALLSAKGEYAFRIWTNGTIAIATNAVAAAIPHTPTSSGYWSSISTLFDEYRVDAVINHFCPIVIAGNTGSNWAAGGYAVCNNYINSTSPTTYNEVLNHAESHVHPISSIYTVGVTSTNAGFMNSNKLVWAAVPPRFVELDSAATVAQAEWIDTAVSWPGSTKFIGTCNGTNGDTPIQRYTEYWVRCRARR